MAKVWIPYYLYTCVGWLSQSNIEMFVYYYICLIIVLTAYRSNIQENIPYKFIIYGGILTVISIFFQILYPSLYSQIIGNKLIQDSVQRWTSGDYGFNGITYQLGKTAEILLFAEFAFLYLFKNIKWLVNRKILNYTLVVIIIVCVFLTGKRMNSAMALMIPICVYFFSLRNFSKRIIYLFIITAVSLILTDYFINNVDSFTDNYILRRTAESVLNSQSDGWSEVSGGRENLFEQSILIFQQNPLFGIGSGEFSKIYGTMVHNLYLQALAEQGLIGFILLVIPMIYCLKNTIFLLRNVKFEKYKQYLCFGLALQFNYIIQGFSDNTSISIFIINAVGIAIVINYKSIEK